MREGTRFEGALTNLTISPDGVILFQYQPNRIDNFSIKTAPDAVIADAIRNWLYPAAEYDGQKELERVMDYFEGEEIMNSPILQRLSYADFEELILCEPSPFFLAHRHPFASVSAKNEIETWMCRRAFVMPRWGDYAPLADWEQRDFKRFETHLTSLKKAKEFSPIWAQAVYHENAKRRERLKEILK